MGIVTINDLNYIIQKYRKQLRFGEILQHIKPMSAKLRSTGQVETLEFPLQAQQDRR